MPSPNRQHKHFPCPTCGEMVGVQSSVRANDRRNKTEWYKRYRYCGVHGMFVTHSSEKESKDETFARWVTKENHHRGGHRSADVTVNGYGKVWKQLADQIERSEYPPNYFYDKGKNHDNKRS